MSRLKHDRSPKSAAAGTASEGRTNKKKLLTPQNCLIGTCLAAVTVLTLVLLHQYLRVLLSFLAHLQVWQSVLLVLPLFVVVSMPFTLGYVLMVLASGYLYGFALGFAVASASSCVGVLTSLSVCRRWLSALLTEKLQRAKLTTVTRVLDASGGLRLLMLIRLTPIPFGFQNACIAATSIPLWRCLAASTIGLLPAQLFFTHLGSRVHSVQDIFHARPWRSFVFLAAQAVVLIAVLYYVARLAQRELSASRLTSSHSPSTDSNSSSTCSISSVGTPTVPLYGSSPDDTSSPVVYHPLLVRSTALDNSHPYTHQYQQQQHQHRPQTVV